MNLDVATVLSATGARVFRLTPLAVGENDLGPEHLGQAFDAVTVDSRAASEGSLFAALTGERVDGNEFIADAYRSGATGAISNRAPDEDILAVLRGDRRTRYLFQVPDGLEALQRLARHWRMMSSAEVVGITGSIGKTTTKEILAAVLAPARRVLKSEANFNTEIGLPLTLFRLRREHQVAVLEMGMYVPGDIALLAAIARPRVGIVTTVAPIHLERVGSIERIARAKSELVAALPPDGVAVLNGDNPWTRAMATTSGVARSVLYGISDGCDYRATDIQSLGLEGCAFTLHAEGQQFPLRTRVPGVHLVNAFLAAAAVGRELNLSWEQIVRGVEGTTLEERQRIVRGDHGMVIVDDSYNAAPMSVNAALDLLHQMPGTRIAVLGDMLELGPVEEQSHRQVGEHAAPIADWLVTRGARSAWIADEAERRGMPSERVRRVADNGEAVAAVRDIVAHAGAQDGTWSILVKGSRGMRMEEVVTGLQETTA